MNRRRKLIVALGAGVVAAPFGSFAQQTVPTIGFISSVTSITSAAGVDAFRKGLVEAGFVEGRNIAFEFRWAEGDYDRLPAYAVEMVKRRVDVICAGGLPSALAAKNATSTIPIVFVVGADPVKLGLVNSLRRPGANITGVSQLYGALGSKRLELLREIVPHTSMVGVVSNPKNPNARDHVRELQGAARSVGQRIKVFNASSESEIDAAFAALVRRHAGAVVIADDPFFNVRREQFISLAARHALPTVYHASEFANAGGLMSYGPSLSDNYRLAAVYVGKILNGAKPADLPVLQPTLFELFVNMKTAKILGLKIPNSVLVRADRVIE